MGNERRGCLPHSRLEPISGSRTAPKEARLLHESLLPMACLLQNKLSYNILINYNIVLILTNFPDDLSDHGYIKQIQFNFGGKVFFAPRLQHYCTFPVDPLLSFSCFGSCQPPGRDGLIFEWMRRTCVQFMFAMAFVIILDLVIQKYLIFARFNRFLDCLIILIGNDSWNLQNLLKTGSLVHD